MLQGNLRRLAYSVFKQSYREDWSLRRFDGLWLAECTPQSVGQDTLALQLETLFGVCVTVRVLFNGWVTNPGGEYFAWVPWGWAPDVIRILRRGGQP
jgi:hypothetical protein